MDLAFLKEKFRHKQKADLSDLDLALKAVPFLIRTIESLEADAVEFEKRIAHLSSRIKRQPPTSRKGKKGAFAWEVAFDETKNRLIMQFSGPLDYKTAKFVTNHMYPVLINIRKGCDVINDVTAIQGLTRRVMFHFKKIFYTLDMMEISRVIHVLPSGDAAAVTAFNEASENLNCLVFTAGTRDEAIGVLDKSTQFLKA